MKIYIIRTFKIEDFFYSNLLKVGVDMDINEKFLIILSGITASGKNTISELLVKMCQYLQRTISCTTRKPRAGERDGKDYYFLERSEFLEKSKKGEFIEFKEKFSNAILFFIQPNSFEVIKERLLQREDITDSEIRIRIKTAKEEIAHAEAYDYIIDNPIGAPEKAASQIINIVEELNQTTDLLEHNNGKDD